MYQWKIQNNLKFDIIIIFVSLLHMMKIIETINRRNNTMSTGTLTFLTVCYNALWPQRKEHAILFDLSLSKLDSCLLRGDFNIKTLFRRF